MYTFEERMKAVELYIQSGYSEGIVIRTLGYPFYTALRNWYKEISLYGQPPCSQFIKASLYRSAKGYGR